MQHAHGLPALCATPHRRTPHAANQWLGNVVHALFQDYREAVSEDAHHGRVVDEMHTGILQRSDAAQRHAWRVFVEPLAPAARITHRLPHL
jgi:hypothetical protein